MHPKPDTLMLNTKAGKPSFPECSARRKTEIGSETGPNATGPTQRTCKVVTRAQCHKRLQQLATLAPPRSNHDRTRQDRASRCVPLHVFRCSRAVGACTRCSMGPLPFGSATASMGKRLALATAAAVATTFAIAANWGWIAARWGPRPTPNLDALDAFHPSPFTGSSASPAVDVWLLAGRV